MIRTFLIILGVFSIAACNKGMESLKEVDCAIAVEKYIAEPRHVMEINKEI